MDRFVTTMSRNFIEASDGSILPTLETINETIQDALNDCHNHFVGSFVVESVSTSFLQRENHLTVFASVVAVPKR